MVIREMHKIIKTKSRKYLSNYNYVVLYLQKCTIISTNGMRDEINLHCMTYE